MKRWLPWIITIICAVWIAANLRTPPESNFDTRDFGRLPVLLNGRIQPMDSVARNSLLQIRNKQSVALEDRKTMSATEWLLEVMTKPNAADERKVFRVDHPELLSLLRLPPEEKHFSFNQLSPGIAEIEKQAKRINDIEPAHRTAFEKQVMHLLSNMNLYHRLKNSLEPEETTDFVQELNQYQKIIPAGVAAVRAREAGKDYDKEAFNQILTFLSRYDVMASLAYPLMVPPQHPEMARDEWKNMGTTLMEVARGGRIPEAVMQYATMATAYRQNKPEDFNRALASFQQSLEPQFHREVVKGKREYFFNQFAPFYQAMVLYVLAFLLACFFWFNWSEWLRRSAFYLLILALAVHTFGLIFRMILEGRPPVTNLYSSAIFIGWGSVILGLFIERFYRDGIGSVTAAAMGFVTLVIAHNLALGGDTMEMLRAVLDTNFWLATHVVTVTIGYASTFVAGFLAILYIVRGVFTRSLSITTADSLGRMVYGVVCFATLFSFIGTVLGGIWADQSWGRFWGWDPKENGALIIVLWNAAILHARWGGMVQTRGVMNMAVFGNIITSFSWFGVNMLGIGLHSYGFMDEAFKWLIIFIGSQLVLIGLGLLPERYWLSFRPATGPLVPAKGKAKIKPTPARV